MMHWKRTLFLPLCLCAAALAQSPIDFSYAGYGGALPNVMAVSSVRPTGGDDTALLQGAIDHVAALPLQTNGFRGAVLLHPGRYRVAGKLEMRASGVVLRGAEGATIVASGKSRRTLIEAGAAADPAIDAAVAVTDEIVPAGGLVLTLENAGGFHVGDRVVITRPSTAAWISALHMTGLPGTYANQRLDWAPGSRNLDLGPHHHRSRRRAQADHARCAHHHRPGTALRRRHGRAGDVQRRRSHIGIENSRWKANSTRRIRATKNIRGSPWRSIVWRMPGCAAWWRGTSRGPRCEWARARGASPSRHCRSEQPVSRAGAATGGRVFWWKASRCWCAAVHSEQGMNDFAAGLLAGGPNVFLDSHRDRGARRRADPLKAGRRACSTSACASKARASGSPTTVRARKARVDGGEFGDLELRGERDRGARAGGRGECGEPLDRSRSTRRNSRSAPAPSWRRRPRIASGVGRQHSRVSLPKAATAAVRGDARRVEIVNGRFVADGKTLWGGVVNDGWWRGQAVPAEALDVGGVAITRFVPGRTGPGLTEDLRGAGGAAWWRQGTPFYQIDSGAVVRPAARRALHCFAHRMAMCGRRSMRCRGRAAARAPRRTGSASST